MRIVAFDRLRVFVFTIAVLLLAPWSAHARTINVPGDVATIQGAIDAAVDGDTVLVAPGTYPGGLTISGKTITLASQFLTTGDQNDVDRTIISGGSPVITVRSAGPDTKIVGFTIKGSSKGVVLFSHTQVLNNHFSGTGSDALSFEEVGGVARNNIFDGSGDDGIDIDGNTTDVIVEDNIIRNSGDDGIEIRLFDNYSGPVVSVIFRNNIISGNDEDGIQIIDYPGVSPRVLYIERNLIQNNRMVGVGMMANGNSVEDFSGAPIAEPIFLTNNTFVGNDHGLTGGAKVTARNNIFFGATRLGVKNVTGSSTMTHSLFWQNGTDHQGSNVDLSTSIFRDPLFDSTFHLQPGSPAIDAGVNVGLPFNGAAPDLGAYESGGTTDTVPPAAPSRLIVR